jgi:hypothetical protein
MSSELHPFSPDEGERTVSVTTLGTEPAFHISVTVTKTQTTGELIVNGSGAKPGGSVEIHYVHVPGAPVNIQSLAGVQDGNFSDAQHWPLTYGSQEDADADVFVMARDQTSGAVDIQSLKAAPWIIVS